MTTFAALFERVDVEARSLRPARVLLTILMVPLFLVGLAVGIVIRFGWVVVSWCWAAAVVGFRSATKKPGG